MIEWKQEEMEHINASLSGAERKAALCALLEQETQLLASIGRHQVAAGERNQEKAVQAFLNKVCLLLHSALSYMVYRYNTQHFIFA